MNNRVIDQADDMYRWYLCVQTLPAKWTCQQKLATELFGTQVHEDTPFGSTIVNVYKFIPSVFDNAIVKHRITAIQSVKVLKR